MKLRSLLAFALLGLLTGCISVPDQGEPFNSANVSKLKVGETTEPEVVKLIGRPESRVRNADGTVVLSYQHIKMSGSVNALNPFDAGRNVKHQLNSLSVTIAPDGKLKDYSETGPAQ